MILGLKQRNCLTFCLLFSVFVLESFASEVNESSDT